MYKQLFVGAVAFVWLSASGSTPFAAEKQNPTPPPSPTQPQPPATQTPPPTQIPPATTPAFQLQPQQTLVGCLYRERDVPGREPNIVERAGILEDYILIDAMLAGKTPLTGKMYKVEKIDDDKLRAHVGKKVEVVGRIDAEASDVKPAGGVAAPKSDKGPGPDKINLPEFEAVSIREVTGTCPSKPVQ